MAYSNSGVRPAGSVYYFTLSAWTLKLFILAKSCQAIHWRSHICRTSEQHVTFVFATCEKWKISNTILTNTLLKRDGCHRFCWPMCCYKETSDTMLTIREPDNYFKMCSLRYTLHATLTCTLPHLIHLFKSFPLTHTLFCTNATLIWSPSRPYQILWLFLIVRNQQMIHMILKYKRYDRPEQRPKCIYYNKHTPIIQQRNQSINQL